MAIFSLLKRKERHVAGLFLVGWAGVLFSFGIGWWYSGRLPQEIPLWYSEPAGLSQLAKRESFMIIPIFAGITMLTNSLIVLFLGDELKVLRTILKWSSVLVVGLLFLAQIHILFMAL